MQLAKANFRKTLNNPEVWRDVQGYEGLYKISYNGFVYSHISDKYLKPGLSRNGYLSVVLYDNERGKRTHNIHTMVGRAFVPNPDNKKCLDHLFGNKLMNHRDCLEWVTPGENNSRAIQLGLKRKAIEPKGCVQKDLQGNIIRTYRTTVEAENYGFRSGNICLVCSGKRKLHGGFKWEYLNNQS